ncbi:MAG: hypothetical protein JWR83_667, partial [Aeromicrobium sp.]|nr:hypothetical protein [Aeromicrobium sp.]
VALAFAGIPAGATTVINMTGTDPNVFINSVLTLATSPQHARLVWNFPNAATAGIRGSGQIPGAVLVGPQSSTTTITAPGTNGRVLLAGNLVHGGGGGGEELHAYPFNGTLPPCDEGGVADAAADTDAAADVDAAADTDTVADADADGTDVDAAADADGTDVDAAADADGTDVDAAADADGTDVDAAADADGTDADAAADSDAAADADAVPVDPGDTTGALPDTGASAATPYILAIGGAAFAGGLVISRRARRP